MTTGQGPYPQTECSAEPLDLSLRASSVTIALSADISHLPDFQLAKILRIVHDHRVDETDIAETRAYTGVDLRQIDIVGGDHRPRACAITVIHEPVQLLCRPGRIRLGSQIIQDQHLGITDLAKFLLKGLITTMREGVTEIIK